jgi:hypothetical protein
MTISLRFKSSQFSYSNPCDHISTKASRNQRKILGKRRGSTTTINERQLVAFCFPVNSIMYNLVQSTTCDCLICAIPVALAQATMNFTSTKHSGCLMLHISGNAPAVSENYRGKGACFQIGVTHKTSSTS